MINFHAHFLPGIDDGARSVSEAAQKIREAGCAAQLAAINERAYRLMQ